jgi:hypothetical protein
VTIFFNSRRSSGSSVLWAGIYPEMDIPVPSKFLHYSEVRITGISDSTPFQFDTALRLLENRRVKVTDLVSHTYPIEEAVNAIDRIGIGVARGPATLGQEVMVTVQDKQTGQPIGGATVSVSLNENHLVDLATNNGGQVSFEYPGETTIIVVSGGNYTPEMAVIPRVPDAWILNTIMSLIAGVVSGLIVAAISRRYLD